MGASLCNYQIIEIVWDIICVSHGFSRLICWFS